MKKILIVEDDKALSKALSLKLGKAGFEVQTAFDGAEAIAALSTFLPDIILLDLVMPVKDGFSVLEDLQGMPQYKQIPVIITSNLSQVEDLERGMQLGAKDYLIKSDTSLVGMVEKVNLYLGNDKKVGDAPAVPAAPTTPEAPAAPAA